MRGNQLCGLFDCVCALVRLFLTPDMCHITVPAVREVGAAIVVGIVVLPVGTCLGAVWLSLM